MLDICTHINFILQVCCFFRLLPSVLSRLHFHALHYYLLSILLPCVCLLYVRPQMYAKKNWQNYYNGEPTERRSSCCSLAVWLLYGSVSMYERIFVWCYYSPLTMLKKCNEVYIILGIMHSLLQWHIDFPEDGGFLR